MRGRRLVDDLTRAVGIDSIDHRRVSRTHPEPAGPIHRQRPDIFLFGVEERPGRSVSVDDEDLPAGSGGRVDARSGYGEREDVVFVGVEDRFFPLAWAGANQLFTIEAFRRDEGLDLGGVDFNDVPGLSNEARGKLKAALPRTVGQAGRLDGVTPAALGILAAYLRREARRKSSARVSVTGA